MPELSKQERSKRISQILPTDTKEERDEKIAALLGAYENMPGVGQLLRYMRDTQNPSVFTYFWNVAAMTKKQFWLGALIIQSITTSLVQLVKHYSSAFKSPMIAEAVLIIACFIALLFTIRMRARDAELSVKLQTIIFALTGVVVAVGAAFYTLWPLAASCTLLSALLVASATFLYVGIKPSKT